MLSVYQPADKSQMLSFRGPVAFTGNPTSIVISVGSNNVISFPAPPTSPLPGTKTWQWGDDKEAFTVSVFPDGTLLAQATRKGPFASIPVGAATITVNGGTPKSESQINVGSGAWGEFKAWN